MQHKLVFIETQDVVETTLALDNYRRACDCGRGAVFFSVARYNLLCAKFHVNILVPMSIKFYRIIYSADCLKLELVSNNLGILKSNIIEVVYDAFVF